MFAEGVHRLVLCCQRPGTYRGERLCDIELEGYQGRSPWLVSYKAFVGTDDRCDNFSSNAVNVQLGTEDRLPNFHNGNG